MQAMLRWNPEEWWAAVDQCTEASDAAKHRDVPCTTITSMQALCDSGNAGARAQQQCAKWGIKPLIAGMDNKKIFLDAARDLAYKSLEVEKNLPGGYASAFVDAAGNAALKEYISANMGEGCANQFDAVVKSLSYNKSGLGTFSAATDLAKPMGEAIAAFAAAKVSWGENYCRAMNASEPSRSLLLNKQGQDLCVKNKSSERALEFSRVVIDTLIKEYSCMAAKPKIRRSLPFLFK